MGDRTSIYWRHDVAYQISNHVDEIGSRRLDSLLLAKAGRA